MHLFALLLAIAATAVSARTLRQQQQYTSNSHAPDGYIEIDIWNEANCTNKFGVPAHIEAKANSSRCLYPVNASYRSININQSVNCTITFYADKECQTPANTGLIEENKCYGFDHNEVANIGFAC